MQLTLEQSAWIGAMLLAAGRCITCGTPLQGGRCPHWYTGQGAPPRGQHVPHPEQQEAGQLKPEHDAAGGCYRVTAPDGWCFEQGSLHELISDYGMSDTTRAQAKKDAEGDCAEYQGIMEPCTDPDCDWCREAGR